MIIPTRRHKGQLHDKNSINQSVNDGDVLPQVAVRRERPVAVPAWKGPLPGVSPQVDNDVMASQGKVSALSADERSHGRGCERVPLPDVDWSSFPKY